MAICRILLLWLLWTRGTIAIRYVPRHWSQSLSQLSNLRMQVQAAGSGPEVELFDQLFACCGWDHAVIIRDHRAEEHFTPLDDALQGRLYTRRHVTLHLNSSNGSDQWLEERLEQLYISHSMTNIIVMTSRAGRVVLRAAANVFLKNSRGHCALMVHRMQFVVFTGELDADHLYKELEWFPFDHVFVIAFSMATRMCTEAYSLMWRKGGTRELEKVDAHLKSSTPSKSCTFFPNLKFKMNGRNLKLLIKEWLSLAYKGVDQKNGQLEYAGLFPKVVHLLSESLNFTYDLLPPAGEDQSLEWDDFASLVSQSKFDMGVGIYHLSSMVHFNHTVTFPIICTNFTGCYVYTKPDLARSPLVLYQYQIYICFICALVYTLIVLKILYRVAPWRNSNCSLKNDEQTGGMKGHKHDNEKRDPGSERCLDFQCQVSDEDISSDIWTEDCHVPFDEVKRQFSVTSDSNLPSDDPGDETTSNTTVNDLGLKPIELEKKTPTKSYYHDMYDSVVNLFFEFIGCSLGQGNLPNPAYFSARLLVWSWCFMVLVLNALFTGNITADLVNSASELPLTTIEDLLARGDYKIFLEKDSSFKTALTSFPEGSTVHAIYIRSEQFQAENPHFNCTLEESAHQLEQQNVVAFLSSPIQESIRERYIPHLISLKNAIFETCSGFILPRNSELEVWISDQLRTMTDAGLINKLKSNSRNATMAKYTGEQKVAALHYNYMLVLFTYCFYGLCCSAVVLVFEYSCARLRLVNI